MGIPYAIAERFEYPVPAPDKWTSIYCKQRGSNVRPSNHISSYPVLKNEDCLQLNVFVPWNTTGSSSLAVMLFITDAIIHKGNMLAAEGNVIVVTAGFRVGVFGFLRVNSDNLKGNYGMMDQIEAMKWMNKNIAR